MAKIHLLAPTAPQRDYLVWLIEVMTEDELQALVRLAFDIAGPLERTQLLDNAAAIAGMRKFDDGNADEPTYPQPKKRR